MDVSCQFLEFPSRICLQSPHNNFIINTPFISFPLLISLSYSYKSASLTFQTTYMWTLDSGSAFGGTQTKTFLTIPM